MRTFIAFLATIVGSAAFQMSVDAGYLKQYAWAVPWVWALCVALWGLWLFMHDKIRNEWLRTFHGRMGRWIIILRVVLGVVVFFCAGYLIKGLIKKPVVGMTAKADGKPQEQQQQQKPEDEKDDKKGQNPKKPEPKPKPKIEQPSISVGSVDQGPCSNTQIGGNGNTATTNCGTAVMIVYNYNGSIRKTVSGGKVTAELNDPDELYLKIQKEQLSNQQSEQSKSLTDAKKLMTAEPQWATPHVLAAFAYINLGDLDAAKTELNKAKALVPRGYEFEEDYAPHFKILEEAIKHRESARPLSN